MLKLIFISKIRKIFYVNRYKNVEIYALIAFSPIESSKLTMIDVLKNRINSTHIQGFSLLLNTILKNDVKNRDSKNPQEPLKQ